MKILSLLLGHFNQAEFHVYRIESTVVLLFKLSDVCSIFNLPSPIAQLESQSEPFYRDKDHDIYLKSSTLSTIAIKHSKFLLAELCKLKPSDYAANLADSILSNIPGLERNKIKKDETQYVPTDIELSDSAATIPIVKSEPVSPRMMTTSDPMAIDTMLTHGAGSQQTRRLSRYNKNVFFSCVFYTK